MAKGIHPFKKRLIIFCGTSLTAATLLGLYAPSPIMFGAGVIVLGLAMVLGILNYLMRPLPREMMPMFEEPAVSDNKASINPSSSVAAHPESTARNVVQLSVIRNQNPE